MNRTLVLTPDDAGAYASYASFLQKAGKTPEALDAFNQSFKLLDAQPEIWSEYADLLSSLGRYNEAADAYDRNKIGCMVQISGTTIPGSCRNWEERRKLNVRKSRR